MSEKKNQVSIISDGTATGTHVMVNGEQLRGVRRIEFAPITIDSAVTATITLADVALNIEPNSIKLERSLPLDICEVINCPEEEPSLGILAFDTNHDYGLVIGGVSFIDAHNAAVIESLEQLENVEYLGPFGSPCGDGTKIGEIQEAISAILANPSMSFSNRGGNRGAEWTPTESKEEEKEQQRRDEKNGLYPDKEDVWIMHDG